MSYGPQKREKQERQNLVMKLRGYVNYLRSFVNPERDNLTREINKYEQLLNRLANGK